MTTEILASKESQKTMGTWRAHYFAKLGKRSVTPGAKKAETCKTNAMQNYFARRSRSYKHQDYDAWCTRMEALNG
jgi:hypothetical protein